jgi:5-methylthioribose kinase
MMAQGLGADLVTVSLHADGYRPMDPRGLRGYLAERPELARVLGGRTDAWTVSEIGDGNLNLVFVVSGEAGSLIVKQALPYIRLVGDSWPLPLSRAHYERMALQEYARHAPGTAPVVHHYDETLALIAMEHLSPHIIMRKGLIAGVEYPAFAEDMADFLAKTLFHTSALGAPAAEHKARMAAFAGNHALCRVTEDLVFTDPYREAPLNRWTRPYLDDVVDALRGDAPLKVAVQDLKHRFVTEAQALIHGDLHTGSIMVTPDSTKVIDPEFAFVGPMGFDTGALLANLLLAFFAQTAAEAPSDERAAYAEWILRQAEALWSGFERRFLALWRAQDVSELFEANLFPDADGQATVLEQHRTAFMRQLWSSTLGFAGCKMIRRIVGLAHVEDFESIEDPRERATGERRALLFGRALILGPGAFADVGAVTTAARLAAAGGAR